jgi:cell volume regulation protein A
MGVGRRLAVGFGGAWVMRRVALPVLRPVPHRGADPDDPRVRRTAALHASGFAAVYTAALVLGNSELPHRAATRSFSEGSRGSRRSGCS